MLPINNKLKLIAIGVGFSILLGIAIESTFSFLPQHWDISKSLDQYFYTILFSPRQKPSENLIIIDSLDPSITRSRSEYADLIHKLRNAGAACIAFDLLFVGEKQNDRRGDHDLVDAVMKTPEVILAIDFTGKNKPSAGQLFELEGLALPDSLCARFFVEYKLEGVDLPFPNLFSATKHIGHINSIHNEYYHFPPIIRYRENCYTSLPLEIVRVYKASKGKLLNNKTDSANGHGKSAKTSKAEFNIADIQLDEEEQMYVNFIPLHDFKPYLNSWHEVLEILETHPERFHDKIILIVNSSPETEIPSPLGPYPRWAMLATITSQLLQNNYIDSSAIFTPTTTSTLMLCATLVLFLFGTHRLHKRWRKMRTLFVFGISAFMLVIYLMLTVGQHWIGVVSPLLIFTLSLVVVRVLYYKLIIIRAPQYMNLGLAVLERQGEHYPIQIFESDVGEEEGNVFFESFLEQKSFQGLLSKINALEASREDIRLLGGKLFNVLFQGEVFYILKHSLEQAISTNKILRLKLRMDAPELICLPWELIHSPKIRPGFLALNRRVSLTRFLPLYQPINSSTFQIPLKILIITAAPDDSEQLDIGDEIASIKKVLRPLILGGDVSLKICEKATFDRFSKELAWKPDIVHYIGHGIFEVEKNEGFLEFENESSKSKMVHAETIGVLLNESTVKLVFLNSCQGAVSSTNDAFTGVAQSLIRVGVPAVIAMQNLILDDSSRWFSKAFYTSFIATSSIDVAVAEARNYVIQRTGLDYWDWGTPVLFMRNHKAEDFKFDD